MDSAHWVNRAVAQQQFSAVAVCDQLASLHCPSSTDFWMDVAQELHKRQLHGDAWDAWMRCASSEPNFEERASLYLFAAECWGDAYLNGSADKAFIVDLRDLASGCNPKTTENLLGIAFLQTDPIAQFETVERALLASEDGTLDWSEVPGHLHGIETATYLDNQRIDCITDWYDFAEAAFDLGLEEKGIKAFIKAFESAKTTDIAAALIGHAAVKLSELGLLEEVVAYSDSSVGE